MALFKIFQFPILLNRSLMPSTVLKRQHYLIDYTICSLLRRKTRNISLLLIYILLVFLFASVLLLGQSLRREATTLLQEAPEVLVQRQIMGRHDWLPAAWLDTLQHLRGVSTARGRLWGYYYDATIKANYTLMAAPDRHLAPDAILIGAALARVRQLGTGDYLSLRTTNGHPLSFKVTGILESSSELLSADLILLSEQACRTLFDLPADVYTDAALTVRNPREAQTVAKKIALTLPASRPILRAELVRTYEAVFDWRSGVIFLVLSTLLLAFAILSWEKAAGLSAEEKREIGILKAIGWETSDVLHMKIWEGILLSLTAFLLGYLLAYWHVFHGKAALFTPLLKGWAVLYPTFQLTPMVDGYSLLALFSVTVLPYTLATLIPGWQAAITDPDAIMRG